MKANVTKESFVEELAQTLPYLYDPGILRRSLLLLLFSIDQKSNPTSTLQNILTRAIDSLKPKENVPPGTNAWQVYRILYYRYVEQFTQFQVANDLALSVRQLRRKEKTALQVLADQLWNQYNLDEKLDIVASAVQLTPKGIELVSSADSELPSQEQELEWLQKTMPNELVDLQGLTEGIVETARPLTRTLGVSIKCTLPDNCPPLNAQLTTVRQALLYIITTAVRFVPQGHVEIIAETRPGSTSVHVRIKAQLGSASLVDTNRGKELEFARKLLHISGGLLETTIDPGATTPFIASVVLPTAQQIPILVIDDNPDLLGLVQRYLSNTRYKFHSTSDAQNALAFAEQLAPEIILLDVMMPALDGWELLGRLREHPKTRQSSIVVCTILPQEQLALSLGAADFIRKPVRREELLAVLDRQMERLLKEA